MACRDLYQAEINSTVEMPVEMPVEMHTVKNTVSVERLWFGVDSEIPATDILQNNLTEFEWVVRNKIYPSFWGRTLIGENALTKEEINFLHEKACKIALMFRDNQGEMTEEQGRLQAEKLANIALELNIPENTAIYLEVGQANVNKDYMKGYAQMLLSVGYTPGFKADTDGIYVFDREYSRGMQTDRDIFSKCLIWAIAPNLAEYERITTTHLIHPDNWIPFAPSAITRNDIAIWQYGKECHPIHDDAGKETSFNLNLVRNEQVMIETMF